MPAPNTDRTSSVPTPVYDVSASTRRRPTAGRSREPRRGAVYVHTDNDSTRRPSSSLANGIVPDATSYPQPPGGLPIATDEAQNVREESSEASNTSSFFGGIGNAVFRAFAPISAPPPPRDRMKEEVYRTKANLEQVDLEYQRAKRDVSRLNGICMELDHENRKYKDTIQSLQRELQEYKNQSNILDKELPGAQAFLRRADVLSISDLEELANTLNDEIFQTSASLGDSLIRYKRALTPGKMEAAFVDVCRTVGDPLARILKKETKRSEPEVNPLLVQIVFEILLVWFCSSKINSWFPGATETSDCLTSIYGEIRRTEGQAVSSRWRALTRAQIRPTSSTWKDEFMVNLNNVFGIAEWEIGRRKDFTAFEQKLTAIFKMAQELRLALGEKVTSVDIEVNVVRPGLPFNHRWMKDSHRNTGKCDDVVAGTTGIGLKKILPSTSGVECFAHILSPRVVLASTLTEALLCWPPPPVMDVVRMVTLLRKEIDKVSDFLAENIRHSSYEFFQEELDCCSQDSDRMVGERLSEFLHEHSEAEGVSRTLIKITIQIFMVSFCAFEWEPCLDQRSTLHARTNRNTAQNHKERKAVFRRYLISVLKVAAWVIPGSAKRSAFEESLAPFFKLMEETEAAWKKIPEHTKVSLSFISPGEDFADCRTYAEHTTKHPIPTSKGPSSSQRIVLGTEALGVRCLFQHREERPRTFLTAKVVLEEDLQDIRKNKNQRLHPNTSRREDGRDP